ncbi:single-strand binding protein (plasmid) [Calothrix sp. NIES-4071]|nr:single-strand binding protein [Calothrix sp. NIES-4071]BAZ64360.1 single-strand binding protein [Calothrix sp. NIES-4105]
MEINKNILIGFVGGDPTIINFDDGNKKATFSLGVKPPYKSDEPLWYEIQLWREAATTAEMLVKKGKLVQVSGRLFMNMWQDKETGAARSKPVINGESFIVLDKPVG